MSSASAFFAPAPLSPVRGRRWEAAACAVVAALAAWFFFWSVAQPGGVQRLLTKDPEGYYPLQAAGFRAGHLYLALDPHPALLALPDPYDPIANAPYRVHDLSLYHERYYMYFGVTPVLLLFLPVAALTGHYPTEPAAVALFCTGAVWTGIALLYAVRRRYFPAAPTTLLVLGTLALAFITPLTLLVEAPQFYQVPISCAIFLQSLMLAVVYRALLSTRPLRWLAGAGFLLGLSLGARPNYLFSALALLAPAAAWVLRFRRDQWKRASRIALAAVFGPTLVVGVALLAYNKARYGSWAEFGMHYQLAGERFTELTQVSPAFIPGHYWLYLFGPGNWQLYFPFFSSPVGQPHGLLRYSPWLWFAGFAFLGTATRRQLFERPSSLFALTVAVTAWANLTLLACFFGSTSRYPGDYAQALLLLAGIGALAVGERLVGFRRAVGVLASVVAAVSFAFGAAVYCSIFPNPPALQGLARMLNWPVYALGQARHHAWGGLRLHLRLPDQLPELPEPILETGRQPDQRDWLQIEYLGRTTARLDFFHAGAGLFPGKEFTVPADRRLELEVQAGSLIPPFAFPTFSAWTREDYDDLHRTLILTVNGVEVLNLALDCYQSSPLDLRLGRLGWPTGGMAPAYSGQFERIERLPLPAPKKIAAVLTSPGPVELSAYFPTDKATGSDPLLVSGHADRSDLLYCIYDGPNRVKFAFDHWGNGGPQSETVAYDPQVPHTVLVLMDSVAGRDRGRLVVSFDGKTLINLQQIFYPTSPDTVLLGYNRFGATSAGRQFNGRILGIRTVGMDHIPPVPAGGTYGSVELSLIFPFGGSGTNEPLVVTGVTGAGDFIYVRYLDSHHLAIGFDHWAVGGVVSEPIEINYGETHHLSVAMDSLYPPGRPEAGMQRVRVLLDGREVLHAHQATYPSAASDIEIGRNQIGGSTCNANFTGQILSLTRPPLLAP